ncbi:MAG TPA: hypothetical protein VNP02_05615, partial [Gammaproteobacteria bacterium]|nr:hypothetical protein [Gammaproteobacteria bacterium]
MAASRAAGERRAGPLVVLRDEVCVAATADCAEGLPLLRGFTPRAAACPVTRFRPRGVGRFDLGFLGMGSSFRGRATQSARSLAFLLRLRRADRRLHMLL